jgi:hypothetical protein
LQGLLKYLLTDQSIVGAVGWLGLLATLIGLSAAIWQIRKAKTAAEAAARATRNFAGEIHSRERLLELTIASGD